MGETMIEKVGIFRTGDQLEEAVEQLMALLAECDRAILRSKVPGMNPELSFALRLKNMLRLAVVTAKGALARTESRGAHYRTDYPLRDDANWLNRTLVRWPTGSSEPEFAYEPVGPIDVPPGFRGYGRDDHLDMKMSVDQYNREVFAQQAKEGRLDSREPAGSRVRWGAWREQL